jgi:2-methylaconitate cis-trans-isomerase PrpF
MADEPKTGEVFAVGASSHTLNQTPSGKARAAAIEAAMSQAVLDASAEGLDVNKDAAKVRERMMAARQRVIDEYNAPPATPKE